MENPCSLRETQHARSQTSIHPTTIAHERATQRNLNMHDHTRACRLIHLCTYIWTDAQIRLHGQTCTLNCICTFTHSHPLGTLACTYAHTSIRALTRRLHKHEHTHTQTHIGTRTYNCARTFTHSHLLARIRRVSQSHALTLARLSIRMHTHIRAYIHFCPCAHTIACGLTHAHVNVKNIWNIFTIICIIHLWTFQRVILAEPLCCIISAEPLVTAPLQLWGGGGSIALLVLFVFTLL